MRVRAQWDQPIDLAGTVSVLRDLSLRHAHLGGRVGSEIARLIEDGDFRSLCDYELVYAFGQNPETVYHCRQALAFWQKLEDLDIGVSKEDAAYSKFVESELQCLQTNRVFGSYLAGGFHFLPRDVGVLYSMRRKIDKILGPVPALADLSLRFGPGATTHVKRSSACAMAKMAATPACSNDLYVSGRLPSLLREVPHWTNQHSRHYIDEDGWLCEGVTVDVVPGRLQFVPKSAKTYRSIVVEPTLNGFAQMGIGDYIARRLKRFGVDITDQARNARLARVGSLTGEFATLDLSSASDTVSRELVRFLLPPDWYALLCAFRTSTVTYRSSTLQLEKFSSMGNGFTFPLETLIFWALTRSVCTDGDIGVYGDDIICPTRFASRVEEVLSLCGFSVNRKKSFTTGPFRESCGHDYFMGINVRPYYQKHLVSAETLFVLHNFYVRMLDNEGAKLVERLIPQPLRLYGPDGYGDGHLLSDDWPRIRKDGWVKKGYSGHAFETFVKRGRSLISAYPGDYISPLYAIYDSVPCGIVPAGGGRTFSVQEPGQPSTRANGRVYWSVPGSAGYKRALIYTLIA